MLKKFVSSLLVCMVLVGCGNAQSSAGVTPSDLTAKMVEELSLGETVSAVEERYIPGLFFFEEDTVTQSSVYAAERLADCLGVFETSNVEDTRKAVQEFLDARKATLEMYAPSELFKMDHAIIEDNGSLVVFVVCEDIENAKKVVSDVLGN